jgi:hypothetical protein
MIALPLAAVAILLLCMSLALVIAGHLNPSGTYEMSKGAVICHLIASCCFGAVLAVCAWMWWTA